MHAMQKMVIADLESVIFRGHGSVDGMYDDIMIAAPRLNAPEIFDGLPDFPEDHNQSRTFLLAVEY